nr:AMP-binding protein [Desulfobulbaceae bacterium]
MATIVGENRSENKALAQKGSNISFSLLSISSLQPDAVALIHKNSQWTFSEIAHNTKFYSRFLSTQGIKKGDRVVLMVTPSMEFICLAFALFAIGAVVILIDPGMGYKNLINCVGAVKPRAFVGIPKAHIFKRLFPKPFKTVAINICVGTAWGILGKELPGISKAPIPELCQAETAADDLAAIIFTTGSTGPPKGVQYQHRIFLAQLDQIHNFYGIRAGEIDQPAFPLFALFSIALGAQVVIPNMDPTRPAQVNPARFISTISNHQVTYSFGSPAIWNVISRYCLKNQIRLHSLKKVLMAGAPVSGELIERVLSILPEGAEVHIPYGATESLPIVSISGSEVVGKTWPLSREGKGTCVGKQLPGVSVKVIAAVEGPVECVKGLELRPYEVGEIVVQGEVVTRAYDNNDEENRHSKIIETDGFWHRIGDVGYFDESGYLWFCGRKAHRVISEHGILYTICCEAIFNQHPAVLRSALVGVGSAGKELPVIIVELAEKINQQKLFEELAVMAARYEHTARIKHFLCHDSFPVDIRHNAKIFREKLAVWAAGQVFANVQEKKSP